MYTGLILLYLGLAALALIAVAVVEVPHRLARRRARKVLERGFLLMPEPVEPAADEREEERPSRAKPGIETYFENGEWKNKVQGSSRAANKHATRAAAEKTGREMARKRRVEHTILNKDGTVSAKHRYGNDPTIVAG